MSADAISDTARRRNPLVLPVRFLLYLVVKALVFLFLGIRLLLRPRLVRLGLLILLVAGSAAWKVTDGSLALPRSAGGAEQGFASTAATGQLPEPAVVEQYLKAQAEYDANGMWETMGDRFKQRMAVANSTLEKLQSELAKAREQGRSYGNATYVGGLALDRGKHAYFYVLVVDGPTGSTRLPYTFVVDQDGKIGNIQWSLE